VLEQLNPMFRVLASKPAATPEQVREVELHFGHIPSDYRTLVEEVTELELQHHNGQYIRIWGPLGSKEMDQGYGIRDRIPDAFPIGDDGGGSVIFYHQGARGPGLYHVGYGNLDSEDATWIARDLSSLLGECSGIDSL
jgi:hypothetical protein